MGQQKYGYKDEIVPSESNRLSVLRDDAYLSRKVRFSFRDCELSGKFCSCKNVFCNKDLTQQLFKRLSHFEEMDWSAFQSSSREGGWSAEKKNSNNHQLLSSKFPQYSTFGHIRVSTKNNNFRIFCSREDDLVIVLRLDPKGTMNH